MHVSVHRLTGLVLACSETNYIIHCAASIRFDEPISTIMRTNYASTRELLGMAARMPNLGCFTYMSTAYVNSNLPKHSQIREELYPLPGTSDPLATAQELLNLPGAAATKKVPPCYPFDLPQIRSACSMSFRQPLASASRHCLSCWVPVTAGAFSCNHIGIKCRRQVSNVFVLYASLVITSSKTSSQPKSAGVSCEVVKWADNGLGWL